MTIALTRLTLGFHVLLLLLCEWETLMPKEISLPQKSHFAMQMHLLNNNALTCKGEVLVSERLIPHGIYRAVFAF